jgi:hypothetical protein
MKSCSGLGSGGGGIRTLGTGNRYTGFRDRPFQPLRHPSGVVGLRLASISVRFGGFAMADTPPRRGVEMPRKPSVRNKNGHWFSEAGGVGQYLGRCDSVTHAEAMARLWAALAGDGDRVGVDRHGESDRPIVRPSANERTKSPRRSAPPRTRSSFVRTPAQGPSYPTSPPLPTTIQEPTVSELMERFLEWLGRHRSDRTQQERRRRLRRFCDAYGGSTATSLTASHLESFQDGLAALHALDYVKKHVTSVRAMFNRGAKLGWLPHDFRPFASVEPIHLPARRAASGSAARWSSGRWTGSRRWGTAMRPKQKRMGIEQGLRGR